jgi:hypothetical protein
MNFEQVAVAENAPVAIESDASDHEAIESLIERVRELREAVAEYDGKILTDPVEWRNLQAIGRELQIAEHDLAGLQI